MLIENWISDQSFDKTKELKYVLETMEAIQLGIKKVVNIQCNYDKKSCKKCIKMK